MSRSVLLLTLGADPLPATTPVVAIAASWVPAVYVPPAPPPPTGLNLVAIADAVTLTWVRSTLRDSVTVIETAPNASGVPGAWAEKARTADANYTLALPGGMSRWVRIKATALGKSSAYTAALLAAPTVVPTSESVAAAQDAADAANAALANIASDSLLTPDEKPRVIQDRDVIVAEQAGIDAQATAYAITTEKTAYDNAVAALTAYLATLTAPVLWSNLAGNTTIVGATFRQKFAAVYATRQALLNKIVAKAKALADAAQGTGDTAIADAAAAQAAANNAQVAANSANTDLANIASDSLLTPDEKPRVIQDRDVIVAEQAGIDAQATAYAITTEKTAYDNAVAALTAYLATLTAPVLWSNLAGNTTIVGATFRAKFADVYTARQALLNKIVDAVTAAKLAGSGINLLDAKYSTFLSLPPASGSTQAAVSLEPAKTKVDGALALAFPATSGIWYYFGSLSGIVHLTAGRYIVSAWVATNLPSQTVNFILRGPHPEATNYAGGAGSTLATSGVMKRMSAVITVPADGRYSLAFDPFDQGAAVTYWIDGVMVEAQVGALNLPSAYDRGKASLGVIEAIAAASAAQDTADGKINAYFQSTMPTAGDLGDLWFDQSKGNKQHRHNGTTYVAIQDTAIGDAILAAAGAQSTADGKITTYYGPTAPAGAKALGDLWYDTALLVLNRWNGATWVLTGTNVRNKNLIVNPTGMHDYDGWDGGWIGGARQRMTCRLESTGFAFACDSASGAVGIDMGVVQTVPAVAGATYTLSASMYAYHMSSGSMITEARFLNSSGGIIDAATHLTLLGDRLKNAFTRDSVTKPAPVGTTQVQILIRVSGVIPAAGAFVRWSDLKLEQATFATPFSDDATPKLSPKDYSVDTSMGGVGSRRLGLRMAGSGHRIGDQRNLPQSNTTAYGSVRSTAALSATSSGAVSINAHSVRYGGTSVAYNAVSNAITGLAVGSTYVIYCFDDAYAGGTRTWFASNNPDAAMQLGDGVVVAGQITIPSSGSAGGGGGGTGDPGEWCVDWDCVLPDGRLVRDLVPGDLVPCWGGSAEAPRVEVVPLRAISFGEENSYTLVSAGGRITQSESTPMDTRDGRVVRTAAMLGEDVMTFAGLRWERVRDVIPVGRRRVVKPDFGNRMFYAGDTADSAIATHNATMKP